jgi:hypothetical protein
MKNLNLPETYVTVTSDDDSLGVIFSEAFDGSTNIRIGKIQRINFGEIFSQLADADIRIEEIQGSIDSLKAETQAMLATLEAIID